MVDVFLIVFVYPQCVESTYMSQRYVCKFGHSLNKFKSYPIWTHNWNIGLSNDKPLNYVVKGGQFQLILRSTLMWDMRSQYWANINLRTNYVVKGGKLQLILRITLQWNRRSQYWATYHLCRWPKPDHKSSGRSNKSKANTNRDRTSKPHKQENKLQSRWNNLPEKYYYILKCSELEWMINFTTSMLAFE